MIKTKCIRSEFKKRTFATFQCTSGLKLCNLDNENIGVNLKNMLSFIVQVVFKSWCEIWHAVIQTQIVLGVLFYHNCTVSHAAEIILFQTQSSDDSSHWLYYVPQLPRPGVFCGTVKDRRSILLQLFEQQYILSRLQHSIEWLSF